MTDHELDQRVQALAARLEQSRHWVSPDFRVREATAAHVLGCTPRTLQRWRESGIGPAFVVVGRKPTYRLVDVIAWLDSRRHDPRAA